MTEKLCGIIGGRNPIEHDGAPRHEHKVGAVAHLISIWFTKVIVPNKGGEDEVLWQQTST